MGDLIFIIIVFGVGFWIGRKTGPKLHKQELKARSRTYSERQRLKVMYATDADRIRELNTLSANDSIFLRLLKQEFSGKDIVIKQKRFFVVDADKYPIAIFEYRDGTKQLRDSDIEDGLPVFLYKAILSSEAIKEDAKRIGGMRKNPLN